MLKAPEIDKSRLDDIGAVCVEEKYAMFVNRSLTSKYNDKNLNLLIANVFVLDSHWQSIEHCRGVDYI